LLRQVTDWQRVSVNTSAFPLRRAISTGGDLGRVSQIDRGVID
jgi:hypothetical protein